MSKIEVGLHAHHASMQASMPSMQNPTTSSSQANRSFHNTASYQRAFAKVNSVVAGSPASLAGLQAGDEITDFGNVNWINHEKLGKVAEVVQRNEGVRFVTTSI